MQGRISIIVPDTVRVNNPGSITSYFLYPSATFLFFIPFDKLRAASYFLFCVSMDVLSPATRSYNMSRIKGKDTKPEILERILLARKNS
jgi:hypothetical protein